MNDYIWFCENPKCDGHRKVHPAVAGSGIMEIAKRGEPSVTFNEGTLPPPNHMREHTQVRRVYLKKDQFHHMWACSLCFDRLNQRWRDEPIPAN